MSDLSRESTFGSSHIGSGAQVGANLSQNAINQASELTTERVFDDTPL